MIMTKQNWLKRSLSLLLALVMCLSLVNVTAFAAQDTEDTSAAVTINDENLRKIICTALNKEYTEGCTITENEMASLTELDASHSDVADIEGLQYAVNLEKLDLSYTKIASSQRFANIETDYLLKMTKLKYLDVSGCGQYATNTTKYWFDDIIRNVGALSVFETLKASDNNLKGQIYLSSNVTYQNLKTLDLSNNYLTAILVSSGTLNKEMFPSIEKINLQNNGFYLDESSEGYSGYVELGIDKFDFSNQRNLANLYAVYVRELGSTSTLVNQYCPYYLCDENGVFDLGTVYADSIICALKGETCGIATTKAEVKGEKYTVVCGYSNNFDADRTQITLSDFKDGENEIKVNVMNINGDTAEYVIKFNKADVDASESEDSAGVKDPALYAAVMKKLGNTDYSHVITKDEMASLTGTIQVNDVTSADGIEYAVNITTLRLDGTFSEFPDISGLTLLTDLTIGSPELTYIPDISSLENLKTLVLSVNSAFL